MFFVKKNDNVGYIPPLDLLDNNLPVMNSDNEVMFALDGKHVVRNDEKYFLQDAINPMCSKEISRDSAYELMEIEKQKRQFREVKIFED